MCDDCFRIHDQKPEAAVPRHFLTRGNQILRSYQGNIRTRVLFY